METENDSPDELEIVYPTLSRELAPSRACTTDDTVPLIICRNTLIDSTVIEVIRQLLKKDSIV